MLAIIILLAAMCLLLGGYIAALFRELDRMADTLDALSDSDTNGEVYTLTGNRQMKVLANKINRLLRAQRVWAQKIMKADTAFKESVTGISHDLRTPLTSVSGYLQMVKSEKTPPEKKAEYFAIIERRLAALLVLLDELFEYTRLETGQSVFQPEKLNLGAVLAEQLALYYEEFADQGIIPDIAVIEEAVTVFCDRKSLERIFQNLIKNALLHGDGGFQVRMEREENGVLVWFANAAPEGGVDPDRIFDRFYTGDKSRSGKSTGLGLAIVRQLANQAGAGVSAAHHQGMLRITVHFPGV